MQHKQKLEIDDALRALNALRDAIRSTFFTTNYAWDALKVDHRSTDDFARREISAVVGERIASRTAAKPPALTILR